MKKLALTIISLFVTGWAIAQTGNHWSPISGTQYNMTVKGIIVIDGVTQANNQLEIGAFCGDECRGSRKAALFPPTGEYPVMLTVVSNVFSGETITFRIYDHATQQELNLTSESTLVFEHNTNQGTMNNWFPFNFTSPASSSFRFTTAGNWSEASNWQGGVLPGADDEVFIDAACQLNQNATVGALTVSDGQSLTLQAGRTLNVTGTLTNTAPAGLVIQEGAQLLNASENVRATMEKDIVAYGDNNPDGWYTIASPMSGMDIEGSSFLTPDYDLYRFNEASMGEEWENYKMNLSDFTSFEKGRGYLYANSNTFSPAFTGTLNNAAVHCSLTYTERPDGLSGFNLVGNPFPHVIYKGNGGAIDNANLASGYYTLTNEGAWHVHTFEDAIQPGQGILVKVVAATNLSIAKNNAAASSETGNAKASMGRMNIVVSGDRGQDRTFVYFGQGLGLNKMDNFNEQMPSLWIRDNGNDYAIAHVNNTCNTLDLFFSNSQDGDFTMTFNVTDTNFSYLRLVDNVAGVTTDLLQHPDYAFHATGQEPKERFKLEFNVLTGVEEHQQQGFCHISNGILFLETDGENQQLTLIDVMGRTVKSMALKGNACSVADLPSGVYLVRLNDGTDAFVQKVVINN